MFRVCGNHLANAIDAHLQETPPESANPLGIKKKVKWVTVSLNDMVLLPSCQIQPCKDKAEYLVY